MKLHELRAVPGAKKLLRGRAAVLLPARVKLPEEV